LTPYAAQILNTRIEDVFSRLGRITEEELQAVD